MEKISESNHVVALVFRAQSKISGTKFFTEAENPLQVGIHHSKTKRESRLHIHTPKKAFKISQIHEFLYVQKGAIKITFKSKSDKSLGYKTLRENDSILIMDVRHQVFFEPGARVIEVKQGPYHEEKK